MKTIKKLGFIGIFAAVFTLSSCSEDEIGSTITNYPVITQNSPELTIIMVEEGEAFTDPGAVATVGGNEVPVTTTYTGRYRGNVYTGTLDTAVSDVYTVTYSAQNEDGFSGTSTREVIVAQTGDLENSIAGLYRSTVFRNGVQGTPASAYTDIEYILIWENEDGTYGISDAFGGWYLFGRAIPDSETPGTVIVANDIAANDFSFPGTQTNTYFGGTSEMLDMTVDPVAKTIDFTTEWLTPPPVTTYTFTVHLEQVQF
jgi:hypothetical protein